MTEVCPPLRTATEQMLLSGEADAAWMYLPWEVLRAERTAARRAAAPSEGSPAAAKALRRFRLADYGVSFGYMNCITCTQETAERDGGRTVRALLDAVAEGAGIARSDPRRAAELLAEGAGRPDDLEDLEVGSGDLKRGPRQGASLSPRGS